MLWRYSEIWNDGLLPLESWSAKRKSQIHKQNQMFSFILCSNLSEGIFQTFAETSQSSPPRPQLGCGETFFFPAGTQKPFIEQRSLLSICITVCFLNCKALKHLKPTLQQTTRFPPLKASARLSVSGSLLSSVIIHFISGINLVLICFCPPIVSPESGDKDLLHRPVLEEWRYMLSFFEFLILNLDCFQRQHVLICQLFLPLLLETSLMCEE